MPTPIPIDDTFTKAVDHARHWHQTQQRKGSGTPYLSHLLEVSGLVLQFGGTQEQAIAGLLHDLVEDCGAERLPEVRERFGDAVADMVDALSDAAPPEGTDRDKAPWVQRKVAHLEHFAEFAASGHPAVLVGACDKVSNARSIVVDAAAGHDVFNRFKGRRYGTAWYYRNMAEALAPGLPDSAGAALEQACRDVVEAAGQDWDDLLGDPDLARLPVRAGGTAEDD